MASSVREDDRPDVAELEESQWTQLARKHWSKSLKTRKVKSEVIEAELWDVLEKEDFHLRSLLILESLQLLEKYLRLPQTGDLMTKMVQLSMAWLLR